MQTQDTDLENGSNTERDSGGRFALGNQVARCNHDYPVRQDTGLARSRRELFYRRASQEDLDSIADKSIGLAKCGSLGHAQFVLESMYGRYALSDHELREFTREIVRIVTDEVRDPEAINRIRNRFSAIAIPAAREE